MDDQGLSVARAKRIFFYFDWDTKYMQRMKLEIQLEAPSWEIFHS